jgi:hypothetical protein
VWRSALVSTGSGSDPMADFHEYDNEPSGFIKDVDWVWPPKQLSPPSAEVAILILSCVRVTVDGVSDWCLYLLTTFTRDSWLHLIIVSSLISTLYKLVQHTLSFFSLLCLHQSFPGNGFNSRGFFNCTDQVFSSQTPLQLTLLHLTNF